MRKKNNPFGIKTEGKSPEGRMGMSKAAGRVHTLSALAIAAMLAMPVPAAFGETEGAAEGTETEMDAKENEESLPEGEENRLASAEARINEKNETVYVISDASGSPGKLIVSDWLVNGSKADSLTDVSRLSEIENLKGTGTYTENADGTITWDAQGGDLYYQGLADPGEELPVTLSVEYLLDGKEISAEEALGASGELTVRYSFENHAVRQLTLDGQTVDYHVPFAAVVGFLADADTLKDARITNGRILSDGSHSVAAGIAFPGLAGDLEDARFAALTKLADVNVPDCVEITLQAENFRPFTAYALVTDELFAGTETDMDGKASELFGLFGTLKNSVGSICDGVSGIAGDAGNVSDGAAALEKSVSGLAGEAEALRTKADEVFAAALESELGWLSEQGIDTDSASGITAENCRERLEVLAEGLDAEEAGTVAEAAGRLEGIADLCIQAAALSDSADGTHDESKTLKGSASSLQGSAKLLSLEASVLKALIPDLSGVSDGLNGLLGLAADYTNFSGIADGTSGKLRFIWKISAQ